MHREEEEEAGRNRSIQCFWGRWRFKLWAWAGLWGCGLQAPTRHLSLGNQSDDMLYICERINRTRAIFETSASSARFLKQT